MAKKNRPQPPARAPLPRSLAPAGLSGQLMRMAGADVPVVADFDAVARDLEAQPAAFGSFRVEAQQQAIVDRMRRAAEAQPNDPLRQLQLADALRRAGKNEDARAAAERCLALDPDATAAKFLLAALGGAAPPETMPPELVATIFDNAATQFDRMLVDGLKYRGPELIAKALAPYLPKLGRGLDILDAGCGTGLCAPHLAPLARRLDGVDLSPKIVEVAAARGGYDRLGVGDCVAAMRTTPGAYDLIVAADVVIYLGALEAFFEAAHGALRPGGLVALSIERGTGGRFTLSPSSRFQHDPAYVEESASRAGFILRHREDCTLRFEARKPVDSMIYIYARRA
jgi:predicted TPR repeat methyltransferase